jgi:hypothetical protein
MFWCEPVIWHYDRHARFNSKDAHASFMGLRAAERKSSAMHKEKGAAYPIFGN